MESLSGQELITRLEHRVAWVALMHREYQGRAMSDDIYDRFSRYRDQEIPQLKQEILKRLG